MKQVAIFLILVTILSCKQKEYRHTSSDTNYQNNTPPPRSLPEQSLTELRNEDVDYHLNTSVIDLEKYVSDPYIHKHLKRLKSVTSYPDLLRKHFHPGSTTNDILKVQGQPDNKVNLSNSKEAWYYGDCEVIIKDGLVDDVKNDDGCLSFCDTRVLMNVPEAELVKLGMTISSHDSRRAILSR